MDNLNTNSKIVLEKLQQLLKKYMLLQKDNETLRNDCSALQKKENEYKMTIEELNQKVNILQAANGNMAEEDQKELEKRIDKYVKEIDNCINILSD